MKLSIAQRYALFALLGFTVFFVVMKMLNMAHILELRILNIVILVAAIYAALKRSRANGGSFSYFRGLYIGTMVSVYAVLGFSILFFFYLRLIDPAFMEYIREHEMFGKYLNAYAVFFVITVEGVSSGVIASFAWMQLFKRPLVEVASGSVEQADDALAEAL